MLDSEALRLSSALAVGALLCAPSLRLLTRSGEERLVGLFFLASGVGFAFRLVAQGLGDKSADLVVELSGQRCVRLFQQSDLGSP